MISKSFLTLEIPSSWFVLPGFWNRLETFSGNFSFVGHTEVEMVLFDEPALFVRLIFVNREHRKPSDGWSTFELAGFLIPGKPLSFGVFKGIMHVLFLIWVLEHLEMLRFIIWSFNNFGFMVWFLGQNWVLVAFVFYNEIFAFFHLSKNVSKFLFKLAWTWVHFTILFFNFFCIYLGMRFMLWSTFRFIFFALLFSFFYFLMFFFLLRFFFWIFIMCLWTFFMFLIRFWFFMWFFRFFIFFFIFLILLWVSLL